MTFLQAVSSALGKYAIFRGRAPRSEYWWFVLFNILVQFVAGCVDGLFFSSYYLVQTAESQGFGPINNITTLALLIPGFAISARRLHDMDRTGWWQLIFFTGVGALVMVIWFMFKGTDGPNRFGRDPLARF